MALETPSELAYSILANFEDLTTPPVWRPNYAPSWLRNNKYWIGEVGVALALDKKAILREDLKLMDLDGSTGESFWLPSGFVRHGGGSMAIPDYESELHIIGRRVSKGDPRQAVVIPAIFSADNKGYELAAEDITSKTHKLEQLSGWLESIQEQRAADQSVVAAS